MKVEMGLPEEVLKKFGIKPGDKITVKRTVEDTYTFKKQEDPEE